MKVEDEAKSFNLYHRPSALFSPPFLCYMCANTNKIWAGCRIKQAHEISHLRPFHSVHTFPSIHLLLWRCAAAAELCNLVNTARTASETAEISSERQADRQLTPHRTPTFADSTTETVPTNHRLAGRHPSSQRAVKVLGTTETLFRWKIYTYAWQLYIQTHRIISTIFSYPYIQSISIGRAGNTCISLVVKSYFTFIST